MCGPAEVKPVSRSRADAAPRARPRAGRRARPRSPSARTPAAGAVADDGPPGRPDPRSPRRPRRPAARARRRGPGGARASRAPARTSGPRKLASTSGAGRPQGGVPRPERPHVVARLAEHRRPAVERGAIEEPPPPLRARPSRAAGRPARSRPRRAPRSTRRASPAASRRGRRCARRPGATSTATRRSAARARRSPPATARAPAPKRTSSARRAARSGFSVREEVDGLEEVRLPLAVLAEQDRRPRRGRRGRPPRGCGSPGRRGRGAREGAAPRTRGQIRIGITTAVKPWSASSAAAHDARGEVVGELEGTSFDCITDEHVDDVAGVEANLERLARRTRPAPPPSPRRGPGSARVTLRIPFASSSFTAWALSVERIETRRRVSRKRSRPSFTVLSPAFGMTWR